MLPMSDSNKQILAAIEHAEQHDPSLPKFPISRTYRIHLAPYTNLWLKDESTNLTGTHKDRMAWEIVMIYKAILRANPAQALPHMSIISAGSAALAIQTQLRKYGLPN